MVRPRMRAARGLRARVGRLFQAKASNSDTLLMLLRNFAVFEGPDGSGRSTQLTQLKKRIEAVKGKDAALFTCEPTGGDVGRLIRHLLSGAAPAHPDTLSFLFAADRNEHLYGQGGVVEALNGGKAVFCDRYLFSSIVYQGLSGKAHLPLKLNEGFPLPEILFLFEIEPDEAMRRVRKRNLDANIKEEIFENIDFLRKVAARYKETAAMFREMEPEMKIIAIDAALPQEEIAEIIWSEAKNLPKMK